MALLTVPDPKKLITQAIDIDVPDQLNRSEWTSRSQTVGLPGAEMWYIAATTEPLVTEKEERPWRAFAFNLRGRGNYFYYPLCKQCHIGPRPRVVEGASSGYGIPLEGMQPNALILEAGQYMTVPLPSGHHRCVMLTSDLRTNSSGQATAQLNIALGESPDAGDVVETAEPFIPVRNTDPRVSLVYDGSIGTIQLALEEAL